MKRMNKMLLVAALAATTLSVQAEQKKGLLDIQTFFGTYGFILSHGK